MQKSKLKVLTKEEACKKYHVENLGTGSEATCPFCGSSNVFGISRVVGYYSPINNWNLSKQAEFEARQRGDYKLS